MLRQLLHSFILREKANSQKYIAFLRNKGVEIGEDVVIYSPTKTTIDITCPWLLTIGNHVRITQGVIILTHDYSWAVLKHFPESEGRILGAQSPVVIGDNVFIGMNAIITRGVSIGNNVIVGAGSVVTKDCESNSVYAGNPAKKIMTMSEYLHKRAERQFTDAKKIAHIYRERFGDDPPKEVFREYFMLFCNRDEAERVPEFHYQMERCANFSESALFMQAHTPMFAGYSAFLMACELDS